MADNIKLVTKEYIDAIETDIQDSKVGQKTPNGGEIFSTYDDENVNKALSEASSAFGQNNIAGCLGFKISNFVKGGYDAQGNPYYAKVTLNTDATHFANIAVGDKVSVRINYNSTGLLVTAVNTSTKTVTLNDLLRSFPDFVASENDYLWCVEKPEAGDTPIGIGAFAGGFKGNQANQDGSFAFGRNNIADGRWSVALGTENKAGYNTFVYGKNNKALRSETSIVLGSNNQQTGYMGDTFITGSNNTVGNIGYSNIIGLENAISNAQRISVIGTGNDTNIDKSVADVTMIGNHLRPHESNQVILGSYNEVNENHRFAVGFGDSESTRKSTLNVFSDGSAEVYTQGITNKSIVQKQYVDNSVANKLDKVTSAGTTRVYTINTDGTQGTLSYENNEATAYTVAQRTSAGNIIVAAPTIDTHATTKKYVDDSIATQVSSVYKAKGSIADISALPTPDKDHEGFVYNIKSEFTTTDLFVEGAGKTYPAGTNVVIVNTIGTEYKYDVLAGMVDLSNYVTNDTFTTGLNGKLDKVTSTGSYRAYIIAADGSQGTMVISSNTPSDNTIANRTSTGTLKCATPTANDDAATKKYVDDAIGNIDSILATMFNDVSTQSDEEPTHDEEVIA